MAKKTDNTHIKNSWDDKLFHLIKSVILIVLFFLFLYPIWFVVIASVSEADAVSTGRVIFLPVGFDLSGYKEVFDNPEVWIGYANTLFYTVAGTFLNIVVTAMVGYATSRSDLPGRKIIMTLFLITMHFGGGLIPTYMNIKSMGLVDTRLLMIIMGLVAPMNIIICRNYFANSIPWELQEAAIIDGASDFKIFRMVVLPLSKAILSVLTIYYAVGHWNSYFKEMIYLNDKAKFPLQIVLRKILIQSQMDSMLQDTTDPDTILSAMQEINKANQIKYALIILATIPLLAIYPKMEKYFEKGVLIGGIKG